MNPAARLTVLVGVLAFAPACDRARPDAGVAVDSTLSREEALARFRADLPPVNTLAGGATSREQLVATFLERLERRDSLGLAALAVTPAEFGYLYYPTTPQSLPPYDLSPSLFWFTLQGNSRNGLLRALEHRGGQPTRYVDHGCTPRSEGENTIWGYCTVRYVAATGDTVAESLFGLILERGGAFKFLSFANKL